MKVIFGVFGVLLVTVLACSNDSGNIAETDTAAPLDTAVLDDVAEPEDVDEPKDVDGPEPEDVDDPKPEDTGSEPTCKSYETSVQLIWNEHCLNCHNVPDADNQLDLTPGQSYQSLMTTISQADPALVFVVPGDPSASYLVTKLTNPTYGFLMPITGPAGGTPIPPGQLQLIVDWIDAGATLEPWDCN